MGSWSFSRRGGFIRPIDRTVRSNYEGTLKKYLETHKIGYEYETLRVPYITSHYYKPDFVLKNGIIIEAKGLFQASDRTKHLDIKKQNPDLDIRFVFMRDQKLNKGSKTKYSDWCKKHGFKYHIGNTIPTNWINEKGEMRKLAKYKAKKS